MRGFRLNSWQRVGIVLSVLWVIVGAWLAQRVVFDPVRAGYSKCISLGVAPSICKAELDKGIARRKERLPGAIGVFALAPISVAWLLTYVIVDRALDQARVPAALELVADLRRASSRTSSCFAAPRRTVGPDPSPRVSVGTTAASIRAVSATRRSVSK